MAEVYLNTLAHRIGSRRECNDAATLGRDAREIERIVAKTGVHDRPVASVDEFTSDLAVAAAKEAIEKSRTDKSAIDTLLVCTQTPDHLIPGVSSRVHGALGLARTCAALDINQGCSGFIYGLHLAAGLLRSDLSRQTLLINADCYSQLVRPDDLPTRVLFGDAAAASLLSTAPGGLRLIYTRCWSDGKGYEAFVARGSGLVPDSGYARGIHMDGPGILNFALRVVPEAVAQALAECGLVQDDIRCFAFHQANSFVIGRLTEKLHLRPDQAPDNCAHLGNTVSASIPLLLQEQLPRLRAGDKILAVGFGVGLSWGAALFEYCPAS